MRWVAVNDHSFNPGLSPLAPFGVKKLTPQTVKWNVWTSILINLFVVTGVIAWGVGFRSLIFQARPDFE